MIDRVPLLHRLLPSSRLEMAGKTARSPGQPHFSTKHTPSWANQPRRPDPRPIWKLSNGLTVLLTSTAEENPPATGQLAGSHAMRNQRPSLDSSGPALASCLMRKGRLVVVLCNLLCYLGCSRAAPTLAERPTVVVECRPRCCDAGGLDANWQRLRVRRVCLRLVRVEECPSYIHTSTRDREMVIAYASI